MWSRRDVDGLCKCILGRGADLCIGADINGKNKIAAREDYGAAGVQRGGIGSLAAV